MCKVDDYCEHLVKCNRKASTINVYRSRIKVCLDFLNESGMESVPERIGENELWFLISNLDGKEQSVRANVEALNRCLKYTTGKDHLEMMDILWNRPMIKRLFISNKQFMKMYRIADPKESLILILGAAMGLRREEIWKLDLSDIDDETMTVRGKGHRKEGLVVEVRLPQLVLNELKTYLKWRSDYTGSDLSGGRLIVFKDKNGNIRGYKDVGSIWHIIITLAKRAGIKATTHSLRRLFCTELHENGCDPFTITDLMRHSDLKTVMIYINTNTEKKKEELEKMTSNLVRL